MLQNILDHMGYEELAANLFRATQTEAKLRRENIQGKARQMPMKLTTQSEKRLEIQYLA